MEEQLELSLGHNYRVAVREENGAKLLGAINALSVDEALRNTRADVPNALVVLACIINNEGEKNAHC